MKAVGSILYLVNSLEMDAPTRLTAALAVGMVQAGWQVSFVSWSRGGPLRTALGTHGIKVYVLGQGMLRNSMKLRIVLDRQKPDIVHSVLVRPTLGIGLARFLGMKKIYSWVAGDHGVHEWHERGRIAGFLMDRIMPIILSQADRVVTVSHNSQDQLISRGISRHCISVIPNGVDVRKYYPGPRGHRSEIIRSNFPGVDPSSTFIIGMAGNLRWLKGHDIMLRALAMVLEIEPSVRLILWGEGPELVTLRKLSKELGIASYVSFAGWDPALESKLPVLDYFIQPSRTESFGLAAAEAMACGVPTLVSNAGGLPELMGIMAASQVFPSEDAEVLAKTLLNFIADQRRRKRLGKVCRLRVLQLYTQQGMIRAMQDVYDTLLAQSR